MFKNVIIVALAIALFVSVTDENPFQSTTDGLKQDYERAKVTVLDSIGVKQ